MLTILWSTFQLQKTLSSIWFHEKKSLQCIEVRLVTDIFAIEVLLFRRYAAHFSRKKINWLTFELKCVSFEMKKKNHESFIYHFTFVVVNSYFVYLVDKVRKLVQKPKWLHHEKMRSDAIVENTAFQFDPFRRPTTRKVHSCLMLAYESSMQVHGD